MTEVTRSNGLAAHAKRVETRHRLSELEVQLEQAAPESLDFDFWNRILETVESLPLAEEIAWKNAHLDQLRIAVRSRADETDAQVRP